MGACDTPWQCQDKAKACQYTAIVEMALAFRTAIVRSCLASLHGHRSDGRGISHGHRAEGLYCLAFLHGHRSDGRGISHGHRAKCLDCVGIFTRPSFGWPWHFARPSCGRPWHAWMGNELTVSIGCSVGMLGFLWAPRSTPMVSHCQGVVTRAYGAVCNRDGPVMLKACPFALW